MAVTRHLRSALAATLMCSLLALALAISAPSSAIAQTATDDAPPVELEGTLSVETRLKNELVLPKERSAELERIDAELDRLTKGVERAQSSDDELEAMRPEIQKAANAAAKLGEDMKPRLATVEGMIEKLGSPPKAGDAPETPVVTAERDRLNGLLSEIQSAIKRADLAKLRADQLISRINEHRFDNLRRNLRTRHPSILSRDHWHRLASDLPRFSSQMVTIADNWWASARESLHWLFVILIGCGALWWAVRRYALGQFEHFLAAPLEDGGRPAYLARVSMAVRSLPVFLLPGLLTAGALYLALDAAGLLNEQIGALALSALQAFALFVAVHALARSILLPRYPAWRLIGLKSQDAGKYLWLTTCLAAVYCFDMWLDEALRALHTPLSVGITSSAIANLLFAGLLFAFAWMPTEPGEQRISLRLLRQAIYWLRIPATLAVAAIVLATLSGFLAFGRFLAGQVVLIGASTAALLLGHLAARALANESASIEPIVGDGLEDRLAIARRRRKWLFAIGAFLLNVALVMAVIVVVLLSWGSSSGELIGWAKSLLFGFEIGKFKFSLVQILMAIALFIAVIGLTRMLQRWLSAGVLSRENIDRGIANSIHSGIGYVGIALAALVGISYAGVDLSSIALIASALSIGIGFGLNAIASNFVSGLIMLIERPIKVGDWVVVGEHQGFVRHISVRATEIETFDRASVLVPNSDFMTSAVYNWTHRNAMGRIIVTIGASYRADPEQVLAVLHEVADNCTALLKYPAPSVSFDEFGASSLDFTVRGFIPDVTKMLVAKTQLRVEIFKAFEAAGIEIPFPQQDVHLRDLDGVRELIQRVALARQAAKEAEQATTVEPDKPEQS